MQSVTASLLTFTAAAGLLSVTPGLDTALVLRTAAREGPRRGLWSGLGIITGCLIWAGSVAAGLGMPMLRHPRASFASPAGARTAGRATGRPPHSPRQVYP